MCIVKLIKSIFVVGSVGLRVSPLPMRVSSKAFGAAAILGLCGFFPYKSARATVVNNGSPYLSNEQRALMQNVNRLEAKKLAEIAKFDEVKVTKKQLATELAPIKNGVIAAQICLFFSQLFFLGQRYGLTELIVVPICAFLISVSFVI